jgi:hypothetical protein
VAGSKTRSELNVVTIAILDDYQNVALTMVDWSRVESKAEITVFIDHLSPERQS